MPIRVYYNNDDNQACTIRPTPLVSIGTNLLKNAAGEIFGVTYTLTLTGTLLADQGSPYGFNHLNGTIYPFFGTAPTLCGPYNLFDNTQSHILNNKPLKQDIHVNEAATSIFSKQKALRALFSKDGQKFELTDINNDIPAIVCYPRLINIEFQEGIYVERCGYTITLECDTLLNGTDENASVDIEGTSVTFDNVMVSGVTENQLLTIFNAAFINDYSEDWSIEVDETQGESPDLPRSYRITHNINATGKTHYSPEGIKLKAWEQARKFVQSRLSNSVTDYPNIFGQIGSGTINLVNTYRGFNHVRNEQLNESAGTYTVSETWLLASGTAYENFNMSLVSSIDSPFVSVSIDGSIKGLSELSPSGFGSIGLQYGKKTAYDNALLKYNQITNSGQFGLTSDIFKRANNTVAVQLNSQPRSINLGSNQYTGDLTYNIQFDNRPTNIISGVLSETISVQDTYPGDIFAVIPVIGRKTGPILQYIGGRTEYKRDVTINLLMDYTKIPYGSGRTTLLLQKPSVIEPTATQLARVINELSPANEPGIRKYFISAPVENWNPKEGTYQFGISWTYELDK